MSLENTFQLGLSNSCEVFSEIAPKVYLREPDLTPYFRRKVRVLAKQGREMALILKTGP